MKLVIGNMSYSSWSLRPWVLLKHFQIPFEQILIKLDLPDTTENILKYSPSGKVPALIDGEVTVWESMAIMEYLNDKFPEKKMYPADPAKRALARSMANEMHAGFVKLRQHCPFHSKKKFPSHDLGPAMSDIKRVKELWNSALKQSGGPFLMGKDFGLVDAMFAPVVGRFDTYLVPVEGAIKNYCESIMALPAMHAWYDGARAENFIAVDHEQN